MTQLPTDARAFGERVYDCRSLDLGREVEDGLAGGEARELRNLAFSGALIDEGFNGLTGGLLARAAHTREKA